LRRHAGDGRVHSPHLRGHGATRAQADLNPDPRRPSALKVRGITKEGNPVRLGNPRNGTEEQTARANAGAKRKADAYAETVVGEIRKWQAKGITTCKDLTDMLTGKIKTRRGTGRWLASQVKRVLERLGS
jgi:hypothetical protein